MPNAIIPLAAAKYGLLHAGGIGIAILVILALARLAFSARSRRR